MDKNTDYTEAEYVEVMEGAPEHAPMTDSELELYAKDCAKDCAQAGHKDHHYWTV
jgi:hypothetical protein